MSVDPFIASRLSGLVVRNETVAERFESFIVWCRRRRRSRNRRLAFRIQRERKESCLTAFMCKCNCEEKNSLITLLATGRARLGVSTRLYLQIYKDMLHYALKTTHEDKDGRVDCSIQFSFFLFLEWTHVTLRVNWVPPRSNREKETRCCPKRKRNARWHFFHRESDVQSGTFSTMLLLLLRRLIWSRVVSNGKPVLRALGQDNNSTHTQHTVVQSLQSYMPKERWGRRSSEAGQNKTSKKCWNFYFFSFCCCVISSLSLCCASNWHRLIVRRVNYSSTKWLFRRLT